ncbi:MAG: hypothetical protein A3K09_03370 [Nitrospinae bacterium RIFCSPLOWO2_12_FULL_47_7]|nr:MAG: hypothetical protein A3K09_03370 [Nitrospinae bacterium RIFCSPLOWO2_12_FULL_47_7]
MTQGAGFVVAGTQSSVGKSSIAMGFLRLFKRNGLDVRPFKVGPDYIDPSHHARACGIPSYNLDSWMCTPQYIHKLYDDVMGKGSFAVVEGVMGLFDGAHAKKNTGSTAEIAATLKLPIVLVVDGRAMARSVAAMVNGYVQFDRNLRFLGVVANRVNRPGHAKILKEAIEHYTSIKFLGALPDIPELKINNRHLGLFLGHEQSEKLYDRWADHIEKHIDTDLVLKLVRNKTAAPGKPRMGNRWALKPRPFSVAIAKDEAFQFVYQDTLDLFRYLGGNIKFFSPLRDRRLPENIDWIYLPGGYPELYAKKLSSNRSMRSEIHRLGKSGMTIVGECGGLMYLGKSIISETNQKNDMVGLFNFSTSMEKKRLTLGYRRLRYKPASGPIKGVLLKGHEFHFSRMIENRETPQMTQVEIRDGYRYNNCFALYSHAYWASSPQWLRLILNTINSPGVKQ